MTQKKILVVEDERAIRDMLAFNLGRAGYDVRPVSDAREARAAIADVHPDLVVMDWMLPAGFTVTVALAEALPPVPLAAAV